MWCEGWKRSEEEGAGRSCSSRLALDLSSLHLFGAPFSFTLHTLDTLSCSLLDDDSLDSSLRLKKRKQTRGSFFPHLSPASPPQPQPHLPSLSFDASLHPSLSPSSSLSTSLQLLYLSV